MRRNSGDQRAVTSENSSIVVERILQVLTDDVVPLTAAGVAVGNKIFGAAIIDRRSLDLVVAGTNEEVENPLYHGEVSALNRYWALPADGRPAPQDCLFVATHEPCSLCLSAITWSGFDNFFYLFTYEDSRDAFAIPHDLRILDEVFGLSDGDYRRSNAFWSAHSIVDTINDLDDVEAAARLRAEVEQLKATYRELSATYQGGKSESDIPLS